jgi:hypothetical protein
MERHEMIDATGLRTFKQFAQESPAFSENSLRHIWAHRFENGAAEYQAVIKARNRLMVNVPNFNLWLEETCHSRTN